MQFENSTNKYIRVLADKIVNICRHCIKMHRLNPR